MLKTVLTDAGNQEYKVQVAQKSLHLLFGRGLPVAVLFLITIIYSQKLSYAEYGRFQSVWLYTNIINVSISFGITSVLLSSNLSALFYFLRRNKKIITYFYAALSIVTLSVFFFYAKSFVSSTKWLIIIFSITRSVTTIGETLLIKNNQEKISFTVNFVYSIFFFAWHYYVVVSNYNLNNLITGILIITSIKCVIILVISKKKEVTHNTIEDKTLFKHWAYLGLNDFIAITSKWIDKIFLLYLLTPAEFAIFFNGSFEIPLFGLLVSVAGNVMLVEMSKNVSTKEKVIQLFTESFRMLSLIVFPLFLFLLLFGSELFAVIFRHKYDASIAIFLISIFIIPIRINNYSTILQYYQKGNKIMAGSVLDICIAVILMLILYPLAGTRGIALSIVLATYSQVFYYLWHSARALNTTLVSLIPLTFLRRTLLLMLALYACLYYSLYNTTDNVKLFVAITSSAVIVFTGLYMYFSKKRPPTNGYITKT